MTTVASGQHFLSGPDRIPGCSVQQGVWCIAVQCLEKAGMCALYPAKVEEKKKGPTGAVGLTLRDWILKWAAR